MEKNLIVNTKASNTEIALLEDNKLVELHYETSKETYNVGDIFLGRVRKLMPGLNAAFVDIGYKKDAFLHYSDLGPKLNSFKKLCKGGISGGINTAALDSFKIEADIFKNGKMKDVLKKNDHILVQILKEPISTKGHRLTCEITMPGRNLVLIPFSDAISVSKKITSEDERIRLKRLISSIKPKNFGIIVRTAAQNSKVAELHEEINGLYENWKSMFEKLHNEVPPKRVLTELDKTSSILRDMMNDSFNKIVINNKDVYTNVKSYINKIAPEQSKILELHSSKKSVFDEYGVSKQIKSSFGKVASLPSGVYLVIEHTEAMHVVDVNSGHKMSARGDQEQNAFVVNMESAEELARQLRLRDIGGLIIVDFIDMRNSDNRKALYGKMKEAMSKDRAQHTILPLSKFGLMQITRQRVKPAVEISTSEKCPSCSGSGKVNASILLIDDIERDIAVILENKAQKKIYLHVHPYIEAFLNRGGLKSKKWQWRLNHGNVIKIQIDNDLGLLDYRFFDKNQDQIKL